MFTDSQVVLRVSLLGALNMGTLIKQRLQETDRLVRELGPEHELDPYTRDSYERALEEIERVTGLEEGGLTYQQRWQHPTSADVMERLDCNHCDFCEGMATGLQAWWSDPNTVQGRDQLDRIGDHILSQYPMG